MTTAKKARAARKTASNETTQATGGSAAGEDEIRAAAESAPRLQVPEDTGVAAGSVTVPGAREGAQPSSELGGVRTPDPETDIAILPIRTRATGGTTATGQALADAEGTRTVPQGEARGSVRPIDGGEPKPDLDVKVTAEARGNQLEPAAFVSNGSVDVGMVGSPSGPVPVAGITGDIAAASARETQAAEERARLNARFVEGRRQFSREEVSRMGGPELRAIAFQYGYDIADNRGTRVTREAFLTAQDKAGSAKSEASE